MWENEHKHELIRNITISILVVTVILILMIGFLTVSKKIEKEDAALVEIHSSQRQELSDARQENKARIDQTYQQHLDVLAQYLPGIVCWGDSLTTGSSGNVYTIFSA